ncbi:MAG TPA: hypothetical protein VKU01_23155 [Bryobacteraceae bacterium]|nr:hypothetical protein [Bryobacteraceae bacterium]
MKIGIGVVAGLLFCSLGWAQNRAGRFDYYILSLSWAPEYCHSARDNTPECDSSKQYGFVVHGLWPEAEAGPSPQNCAGSGFDPRAVPGDLLEIMPSQHLVEHEWETHGRCSGLGEREYFQKVEAAWALVKIPAQLKSPRQALNISPIDIRTAFASVNAGFPKEAFAVNDNGRYLREVRVCLTTGLKPRPCTRLGDTRTVRIVVTPVR